jgi:hypothetical protein
MLAHLTTVKLSILTKELHMDIYKILSTKPHNERQLKIYIKFINRCIELNNKNTNLGYTEQHHICPKGNMMFP